MVLHSHCIIMAVLCIVLTIIGYRATYLIMISLLFYICTLILNLITTLHGRSMSGYLIFGSFLLNLLFVCRLLLDDIIATESDNAIPVFYLSFLCLTVYTYTYDGSLWKHYESRFYCGRSMCTRYCLEHGIFGK